MSIQMLSDLLSDLSTEQQELLAGGVKGSEEEDSEDGTEGTSFGAGKSGLYRIRSRSLVRVQKLS